MTKVKAHNGFTYTTAIKKLRKLRKRIRIIPGGTSAGKTFGILPILIDRAAKTPNLEISVVSESIPHLRRGAMKDFKKIMQITGRWVEGNWKESTLTYTFSNKSFIEFFGADQPDKLRGARRNILYVNECNNVHWEAYKQLSIRTDREIWLDFNPTAEFWVHTELMDDEDSEHLRLTYKDNESLAATIVKDIEKAKEKAKKSKYWANWWRVYGLGLVGSLEGVVFDNYRIIDSLPPDARLIGAGLDFGYSNDPTAIVFIYQHNRERILRQRLYRKKMLNSEIAKYLPKGVTVYADSAEPKSIAELKQYGYDVRPVTKGKDSINFGIQTIQNWGTYLVTADSVELIKELRNYCYDEDKDGRRLNKPIDMWNHAIDAWRYHEMETLGVRRGWSVV